MKNLFIALIGLFVFIGCSKSFKEVEPEIEINKSNLGIMEKFDISPNDTSGLKIFGLAVKRDDDDTIALLGNKQEKLWVQILHVVDDNYKKITNFMVDGVFNDRIEIDLGYGEKITNCVSYLGWSQEINNSNYMYVYSSHDYKNFTITKDKTIIGSNDINDVLSWIICDDKINQSQIFYWNIFADGYLGRVYKNNNSAFTPHFYTYVCNRKGEALYEYKDEFKDYTFINLYEYIKYSDNYIILQNAEIDEIVWRTQLEEMGQIIDGHKPKIEYSFQITDNTISYTFNITNYDGSKETKKIKIDTVSGEIIRACLNFIQQ